MIFQVSFTISVHEESLEYKTPGIKHQRQTLHGRQDTMSLGVIMVFFTSIVSCERVFHTMGFTFGLCGPLALPPALAVITDKCYNGGFLVGRYGEFQAVIF